MWLSTKNMNTDQPSKKLDNSMIDPFEIIKKNIISLELLFPQTMKIQNVFQLNLLQKTLTDLLIGQGNELVLAVIINNEEKWEVEDILDARSF